MQILKDDKEPAVFYTRFICEDLMTGEEKTVKGVISVHLCPTCSNTHFELMIGSKLRPAMSLRTMFEQRDAETLAAELNCPCILAK